MKEVQVTPAYIRDLINEKLDVDLCLFNRKRHLVYLRYVAYKLSRDFGSTLSEIGQSFDRDHATIMHGIKQFEIHKDQKHFDKYLNLYYDVLSEISERITLKPSLRKLQTEQEIRKEYQYKFDKLTNLYRNIIRKQKKSLSRYEKYPIFEKIAELPEDEFKELKDRINAFFIMNSMNEQRKRKRKLLINK